MNGHARREDYRRTPKRGVPITARGVPIPTGGVPMPPGGVSIPPGGLPYAAPGLIFDHLKCLFSPKIFLLRCVFLFLTLQNMKFMPMN